MTVSGFVSTLRILMGDTDDTNYRYSDATFGDLVDRAQKEFVYKTNLLKSETTKDLNSGQSIYVSQYTNKFIRFISPTGKTIPMVDSSIIDTEIPSWETHSGEEPKQIVMGHLNKDMFQVYPTPSVDYSITIQYVEVPHSINFDDEIDPLVPLDAIEYYVTSKLLRFDMDGQNRQFGAEQLSLYKEEVVYASK